MKEKNNISEEHRKMFMALRVNGKKKDIIAKKTGLDLITIHHIFYSRTEIPKTKPGKKPFMSVVIALSFELADECIKEMEGYKDILESVCAANK